MFCIFENNWCLVLKKQHIWPSAFQVPKISKHDAWRCCGSAFWPHSAVPIVLTYDSQRSWGCRQTHSFWRPLIFVCISRSIRHEVQCFLCQRLKLQNGHHEFWWQNWCNKRRPMGWSHIRPRRHFHRVERLRYRSRSCKVSVANGIQSRMHSDFSISLISPVLQGRAMQPQSPYYHIKITATSWIA